MAGINSLNRLKNINFAPNKNVAKTTAAATVLFLSTVACNLDSNGFVAFCLVPLVTVVPLVVTIGV